MAPNLNDVVYGLTAGGAKVALKVDADGVLQSSATLSGSVTASTEYTEGATDATITGGVVMWEDGSDTIRAVSAAKPLPVAIISSAAGGDASAAKQDTGNATLAAIDGHVDGLETSVASIDTKTPALGQALAAASVPVVLTSAQITTLTPPAAITGFATSAKQDTGNTSIASIDTKTPALGQAVAGSSVPVVLTAAQITTLTPPAAITGFATEATLAAVDGHVDGIETLIGTTNTEIGATNESSAAADNSTSGLNGLIKRLLASITLLRAQLPTALGSNTAANSLPVTLSTDGPFPTLTGAVTETAPATDTASSGLNGRLQRIAQRLTSLIALFPTALGSTTSANSFPVTLSSDGPFSTLTGAVTETAPATDTASSGTNGRLQRIAQRLTSLIALVPAALGQGTMAQSFRVVIASDQAAYPVTVALPTVVYNGLTNVTTAGTRVVLAASQAILSGVTIKAKAANTGTIYVGSSAVSSANGYALAPGDSVFLEIANLNTVNIDSSVNGEGVTYIAT